MARNVTLDAKFFTRSPVECARDLIGCRFVWGVCQARIVETEAYAATGDPACHTHFRRSACDFVARHSPGTAYVYLNYGMYWLFNVLVKGPAGDGFVLFRALEPLQGLAAMRRRRGTSQLHALCSGPGKLTMALGIDARDHGREFLGQPRKGLIDDRDHPPAVHCGPRVGISRAIDLPWRFRAVGSGFTSTPNDRGQKSTLQ